MKQQFSYLESNPKITAVIFQEEIFREYPEIKNEFKKLRDKREKIITKFIKRAQKQRKVSLEVDAQSFALLYMGGIRISVLRWKNKNFSYSLKNQADIVLETLFQLLEGKGLR